MCSGIYGCFCWPWFHAFQVCCSGIFLYDVEMVPVASVITGITFVFTLTFAVFILYGLYILTLFRFVSWSQFYLLKFQCLLTYYYWTQLPQLMPESSLPFSGRLLVLAVIYFLPWYKDYICVNVFTVLKLRNLHERKHKLDADFVTYFLGGSKSCPSWMDSIGLRVPTWIIRSFP